MADAADYGELLRQLREDIAYRRLDSGMQCLEANRSLIGSLAPTRKSAGVLLGYLAQWVDIGFEGPQLIKSLLPRFPKDSRAALPLLDCRIAASRASLAAADARFAKINARRLKTRPISEARLPKKLNICHWKDYGTSAQRFL